jgi:arylsulfatase A-like enzyme
MTTPIVALLVALPTFGVLAENEKAPASTHWKAGAATVKITPERRLHMAGYDARKEPAEGTEQDHPDVTALFMMGCGGEQNPYPRNELKYAKLHGRSLASAVEAALEADRQTTRHQRTLDGPLRSVLETVDLEFATPDRPDFPYPAQVIRFGNDLVLIALGSEAVVDYSLRLKNELAKPDGPAIWVAGYSNVYSGYIPSRRVLLEGGYEAVSRPWRRSLEERIVGKVHELVAATEAEHPKAVAVASAAEPASGDRPNILFLFSDDQRADTIAAWGNPHIQTPNLDALARSGCSFRGNYCFGGNSGAVCVPSRAMLHTGRNWFHVRNDMSDAQTLGSLLRQNGYATFGIGKWHNGAISFLRSFERGKAVFFGGMSDHTQVPLLDLVDGQLVNGRISVVRFSSELFANAAVEFLRSYRGTEPFFCYVAFTAPHDPRQPPLPYRQMYYENRPPLPANFLPQHPFDNGYMAGGRDEELAPWPRTREVISDQLAEYYGLITHLDEQIGRVLDALEQSGQADNTYVIFASDQGLALGSHGLLGKQSVYEHSMRSPLILVGPGVPAGKSTDAFTYLLDLYPTICGLTGITPPAGLDGYDLAPLWTGQREQVRDSIFLPFQDIMRAVRDRRWKLIQYPQINHTQLFDLESDPHEMTNLAADPAHAETLERMFTLLKESQKLAGDDQPLWTDNPKRKEIDLTGRQREPDPWQPSWIVEKYFNASARPSGHR